MSINFINSNTIIRIIGLSVIGIVIFVGIYTLFNSKAETPSNTANLNPLKQPSPEVAKLIHKIDYETQTVNVIAKASTGHPTNPGKDVFKLNTVSDARYNDMSSLITQEPSLASKYLLSSSTKTIVDNIPGSKSEKPIQLSGYYTIQHINEIDYPQLLVLGSKWQDKTYYGLYNENGDAINVAPNTKLTVSGYLFNSNILATKIDTTSSNKVSVKDSNPISSIVSKLFKFATSIFTIPKAYAINSGADKVAVIAVQTVDDPPYNMTNLRNVWANNTNNNIVDYYNKVSYGKLNITPDFYGPYTLPAGVSAANYCQNYGLGDDNIIAQASSNITFANYNTVVFAINCGSSTGLDMGASGVATVGDTTLSTPQGNVTTGVAHIFGGYANMKTTVHEVGHTYGALHSGYYNCVPDIFESPTRFDQSCSQVQYGDPYDPMGGEIQSPIAGQTVGSLNSNTKNGFNWFNSGNVVNLNSPGTYTYNIQPLENSSTGVQTIHIPRGTSGTGFWLEYRQPTGYDTWQGDNNLCPSCNVTQGVSIRIADSNIVNNNLGDSDAILDNTPLSKDTNTDVYDGALLPGKSFNDPSYGINVTTNSVSSSGANVTVTLGSANSCIRNAPSVNVPTTTQSANPGQTVNFSVTVTDNDSSTCSSNKYRTGDIDNTLGYGGLFRDVATPNIFTLSPGQSKTINIAVTQPTSYSDQQAANFRNLSYSVCGNYLEANCTRYTLTLNQTTPADTSPPSTPTNFTVNDIGSSVVSLKWGAPSDNVGIAGYNIYRNGALINTVYSYQTYYFDSTTSASSTYTYQVAAYDYKNNLSSLTTPQSISTPSIYSTNGPNMDQRNIHFTINNSNSITMSWDPPTDDAGVAYYMLSYQNNEFIVPATVTSYTFNYLAASTAYTFYVNPFDGDDNYGDSGPSVAWTPAPGTTGPTIPNISYISHIPLTQNQHAILISPSTSSSGPVTYKYYLSDRPIGTTTYPLFINNTYPAGNNNLGDYVQAIDSNGNISQSLSSADLYVQGYFQGSSNTDTVQPTVSITSPSSGTSVSNTGTVNISASDNISVSSLELLLDNTPVNAVYNTTGQSGKSTPNFTSNLTFDSKYFSNGQHTLTAKAFDGVNGNSGSSSPVTISINNVGSTDTTPPTVSITSPIDNASVSGQVPITANASDNVGVTQVAFQIDGTTKVVDTASPYTYSWDSSLVPNGSHTISAIASDAAGNTTTSTVNISVNNIDTTPPTISITSPADNANVTGSVPINASASDNVGITQVVFQIDGNTKSSVTSSPYSYTWDTNKFVSGTHTITAIAYDAAGNTSTDTISLNSTNGDHTPPTSSITSPLNNATVSGNVPLAASSTDNVGVLYTAFLMDGYTLATDTTAPYTYTWDSTSVPNGIHTFSFFADDIAGNYSIVNVNVNVNNGGDTSPPSQPTNLTSIANAYNRVTLNWTASTDNVGVAGYYIVRNGTTIAQSSGTNTTFVDNTVNASTSYSYQVMAYDAASNTSNLSIASNVTTPPAPDTTPPSQPTSLIATAASTSQINLTWNPSSDNIGVAGYDIYRNGTKIATSTSNSFGDVGLSPSTTYSYYVIAKDSAGNSSLSSNTASATTNPVITNGSISGTVSSSNGGGTLSGVTITINFSGSNHTYSSSSNGTYSIPNVPAGSYPVTYSKTGYISQTVTAVVTNSNNTVQNVTLKKGNK